MVGFYPEITNGYNFNCCLATLRRILGLWNRSTYSNTSALVASSIAYIIRYALALEQAEEAFARGVATAGR